MLRIWVSCLLLLQAGAALAGPWPRQEKTVFLSISTEHDRDGNSYTGLYGEYGLSARSTLGLELGRASAGEVSALLWLQRALDDGTGANRWTVSSGVGVIERDGELVPLGQVGVAWGRGLDRLPGGGWISVEARLKVTAETESVILRQGMTVVEYGYLTPEYTAKADVTLGWNATPKMMLINQLRLEDRKDMAFSAKLGASIVRDIGGPVKLELGVIAPVAGEGEYALRAGTWFAF